jgi:hypothetical protein
MTAQDVRTAVAAAVATLLGSIALRPVYATGRWFPPVLAVVLVVLAGGLLLRGAAPLLWTRVSRGRPAPDRLAAAGVIAVPLGQLALVACLFSALYAPSSALFGVLATPASLADVARVLADGAAEVQEQAPPALPLTGLVALTTLLVAFVAVVVDLIAVAGRQPAVAGLGLLVLYCVPVGTISGGIGVTAVAAPAAGLALLLWIDQHGRLERRERFDRTNTGGLRMSTGTIAAVRIGASALVTGVVVGAVVPTLAEGSLATGLGGGAGGSTGTSLDPVAELRGQLTLPEPIDLFQLNSSVDDPGYLRSVALDQYDPEVGWTMSNLAGEISIADDDRLYPPEAGQTTRRVTDSIQVIEHDDRFLPVPTFPLSVQMDDDSDENWRFDPATGTIYGRDVRTLGASYTVEALEPRPSPALLRGAEDLPPSDDIQSRFTALPPLDPSVTDLVIQLTADADGPYERVRAILDYLTDRANGFIYSLSTAPGTSGDDLVDFLRLKRGYCEQYAGAMTVLVRAAGVPARMALGYTPGGERQDGRRVVTSDDAHAWVEVWFDGLGWVPFDPTPIGIDRSVDLPWAPRVGDPAADDPGSEVAEPTAGPQPSAPRTDRAGEAIPTPQGGVQDSGLWPTIAIGAGAVLLVAVLVGLPFGARAWQRRRRIADGRAAALWDELAATALDVGVRPHPSWTPRQTGRELARAASRPGAGSADRAAVGDAVERLARAEEAASYAPAGRAVAGPELVDALRTARRGLLATASPRARLRAVLWPASLLAAVRAGAASWAQRRPALLGGRRRVRSRTV